MDSLIAQLVKNLPAMQETLVRSLGWKDPLEKEKATHSSILAWRIPWTRVHGVTKSDTTERLSLRLVWIKIIQGLTGNLNHLVIQRLRLNCLKTDFFVWRWLIHSNLQFSSVAQSCLTLCDPMNHSTPGLPVHHQLPEFTQTHVHRVSDAIQPSHPLSSPSPPAPNPSQHQGLP